MSQRLSLLSLYLSFLSLGQFGVYASVVVVIGGGDPPDLSPKINVSESPPFVVANHGISHDFELRRSSFIAVTGEDSNSTGYFWEVELLSGPEGMTITDDGILSWIPDSSLVNESISFSFRVNLTGEEIEPLNQTFTYDLQVLESFPELLSKAESIILRGSRTGGGRLTIPDFFSIEGYEYDYVIDNVIEWSLSNAPPGFSIGADGSFHHWRSNRVKGRVVVDLIVKGELPTPSGWVGKEIALKVILLPQGPFLWRNPQGIKYAYPRPYGHLGFSLSSVVGGYFAAGEPGILYDAPGKVRLYHQIDETNWNESAGLTADVEDDSIQALGVSVALSKLAESSDFVLAAGAPESAFNMGKVVTWSSDDSGLNWSLDEIIESPVDEVDGYFGGWVDLEGATLIASIDGDHNSSGALAIYSRGDEGWSLGQILRPDQLDENDYFSYPCAIDGAWIASAANEDDDGGLNAGAVYLYELEAGAYVLRQKLISPTPSEGALFGERLLLDGQWLFVSAFRENSLSGAVYVFREDAGSWSYFQKLEAPFVTMGSRFGTALSVNGNKLVVSAPGTDVFGAYPEIPTWIGLTSYGFNGQQWEWENEYTNSFRSTSGQGWSLAQISESQTVVAYPSYDGFDGEVFLFQWLEDVPQNNADLFESWQQSQLSLELPPEAILGGGDLNHNGIPNLIEWAMGANPEARLSSSFHPNLKLARMQTGWLELEFPELVRGFELSPQILYSYNLVDWLPVEKVRWLNPDNRNVFQIDAQTDEEIIQDDVSGYIQIVRFPWSSEAPAFFKLSLGRE